MQDQIQDVGARIADLVTQNGYPGFTGLIADPDQAILLLCWLRGDSLPDPIAAIVADPGQPITVIRQDADYSYADLESRVGSILGNSALGAEIGGAIHTVDVPEEGTGLRATVQPDDPNADPGQFIAQAEPILSAAAGVPVTVTIGVQPEPFTRLADTSPFFGGARIRDNAGTGQCTSGFGLVRRADLAQLLITANHCYANGQAVFNGVPPGGAGRVQIGTVRVNVPRGDSEAIQIAAPGTAGAFVYVGGVNNPTEGTARVTGVRNNIRNLFVCASGSFTGESCRLQIVDTGRFINETVRGVPIIVGPLNRADSVVGAVAAGQGDSGGPVIRRGASPGRVDGMGTIISGDNQFLCPGPRLCSTNVIYNKLDFLMINYGAVLP